METENINLTSEGRLALDLLRQNNGTYHYYDSTLGRLFNLVIDQGDEVGMSDVEAMSTLRALKSLRHDLAALAGDVAAKAPTDADSSEMAERIDHAFAGIEIEETSAGTDPFGGAANE